MSTPQEAIARKAALTARNAAESAGFQLSDDVELRFRDIILAVIEEANKPLIQVLKGIIEWERGEKTDFQMLKDVRAALREHL
jgi:hypothetical protein